jgi:hypothetical protein
MLAALSLSMQIWTTFFITGHLHHPRVGGRINIFPLFNFFNVGTVHIFNFLNIGAFPTFNCSLLKNAKLISSPSCLELIDVTYCNSTAISDK